MFIKYGVLLLGKRHLLRLIKIVLAEEDKSHRYGSIFRQYKNLNGCIIGQSASKYLLRKQCCCLLTSIHQFIGIIEMHLTIGNASSICHTA